MEPPVGNVFLTRPFFLDLVNAFLHKLSGEAMAWQPEPLPAATAATAMTTDALLNLLAPPVGCDFTLTDPTDQADSHRTAQTSGAGNGGHCGRSAGYPPFTAARRGRPRRHYGIPADTAESSSTHHSSSVTTDGFSTATATTATRPSTETNLRELVYLFGSIQEDNLLAASEILETRQCIMTEFANIINEVDLDSLIGVGRRLAQKHTLNDAVDQLFKKQRINLSTKDLRKQNHYT